MFRETTHDLAETKPANTFPLSDTDFKQIQAAQTDKNKNENHANSNIQFNTVNSK